MRHRRRVETKVEGEAPRGPRRPEPLVATGGRSNGKGSGGRRAAEPPPVVRRSRASRHPFVILMNLAMTLLVIGVVGGAAVLFWGQQAYTAPGPLAQDVAVIIDRGASTEAIATGLEQRGVISNKWVFLAAAAVNEANLKAGEYVVPANASIKDVIERFDEGRVVQHAVTVAEGLTAAQVVSRLNDSELLSGIIARIPDEGSLLPETYQVTRGMSRQALIDRMQAAHEAAVAEVWEGRDANLPISSPRELVILASIIEKETGVAAERERIAGVFGNRLRRGMRLQTDPTILYGIYGGDAWSEPRTITREELNRPNPYNTYQIEGLPPGPIANPGLAALRAAANPMETDELYFVADGTGGHAFARTLGEHEQNVARWREIERQRGLRAPTE